MHLIGLSAMLLAAGIATHSALPCEDGQAGPFPCHRVDLAAFVPVNAIGGGRLNDVWGWTDPEDGREYAVVGRSTGTSFVDVTDPENPVYLGQLPTRAQGSAWRDAKVYADHAFIVSEEPGHGMQVFDLRRLRDVSGPPVQFNEDAHYGGFGNAHNIELNTATGYAYAVGSATFGGGPHFIDVSDPRNPVQVPGPGGWANDGYTHDAQCVVYGGPDERYAGREICFNSNENTLTVVDVENKALPVMLARASYPRVGYTHQGWLSEDHRWFYLNDELDVLGWGTRTRTLVWDLTDLHSPQLAHEYYAPAFTIHHNNYVHGDYLYQSNYTSGLRILDISTRDRPVEFGYFDSQPGNDSAEFSGTWSNYPWFSSGTVVFTDIHDGLFIVRPRLPVPGSATVDLRLAVDPAAQLPFLGGPGERMRALDISIDNHGAATATGLELVASSPAAGWVRPQAGLGCDSHGPVLRCRLDDLPPGGQVSVALLARAAPEAADPQIIVQVTADQADTDTRANRVELLLPERASSSGCSLAGNDWLRLLLVFLAMAGLGLRRAERTGRP
jgi:choice-of-anchor B domain-containing protein